MSVFKNRTSPYIIAEIGSNWHNKHDAVQSIGIAAACGVDAVKFQLFSWSDLWGPSSDGNVREIEKWLPQLKEKAEACGIDFLCSAFSPEGVERVDPYVSAHKIAAPEAAWPQLLEAVAATEKPVIITCGSLSINEVSAAVQLFTMGDRNAEDLCLLYGEPEYPSVNHNLFLMERLRQFNVPVGLSDHSLDTVYTPLSARVHFDAAVIEKHVQLVPGEYPDSCVSIDREGLHTMVLALRAEDPKSVIGTGRHEYRTMYRRRLVASRDIKKGEQFEYGSNFGAFRSKVEDTRALPPYAYRDLNRSIASEDITAGEAIGPKQVEWDNAD
jgi:sialic acid synthase SpsE